MIKHQYTKAELENIGLGGYGQDVTIDRSVVFFQPQNIHIGSHVRIDANVVISASPKGIYIGSHVHLAVGVILLGNERIEIADFCGLSAYVSVFSSNDDYSGGWLTNPTVPTEFRRVKTAPVILRKHAIIGSQSVILPGVTLGVGASVGALSLVNKSVPDFMVVTGNPLRKVGHRDRAILDRENEFLNAEKESGNTK
jgi:galactoside O-acetyltransferase